VSFTLREEHWLRVFQNRVLRNIFGPDRKEVTGDEKFAYQNGTLHQISSGDQIRDDRSRACSMCGKEEKYTAF
jgi:hypothetical protein